MKNLTIVLLNILLCVSTVVNAQSIERLREDIKALALTKNARIGVAIKGVNPMDSLSLLGDKHFPMQSVFKFPIALTMLAEVDKGNFSLDQKIYIAKENLLPGLWSPIREKYPEGVTLPISEILNYTVSSSDNVGCDILLELLGKPQVVESFMHKKGLRDFAVKINEQVMQSNWDLQYLNWTTPKEANKMLEMFYENTDNQLSWVSHNFIWNTMKDTESGENRLKGQLPEGIVVAHKTGWSGVNKQTGISAAVNDIGVVFLENGSYFYISVFITDSKEDTPTNERVIADIAKLAWDYFNNKDKQIPKN
ncbi:class A beta-lactamase, subclass A2 [Myroides sp. LJL115]